MDATLLDPAFATVHPVTPPDLTEARDRDLMKGIASGADAAFRELFDRYSSTASALALRVVRQQQMAEEVVQEAFLAVWRKPDGYVPERGSVRSWLMSLVHNRAVDIVRREESNKRRSAESAEEAVPVADPATDVAERIDLAHERTAVREALGEIPVEQRRVIELMYFAGMSQSQIAEREGIPLGTVKSRALLAMRRLRGSLIGSEE